MPECLVGVVSVCVGGWGAGLVVLKGHSCFLTCEMIFADLDADYTQKASIPHCFVIIRLCT